MADVDTKPVEDVSEQQTEEKLASLFAEESDDEAQAESEESKESTDTEDEESEAKADDSEEVEYEGKAYKVPRELKDAILRQSDYTKKTQEVATLRRQVEDKTQFMAAKEALLNAASEEIAELRSVEKDLERLKGIDWQQLHAADPAQAFSLMQRQRDLESQIGERKAKLGHMAQHAQSAIQQHQDKQWQIAVEGAKQRLGKFSQEDDKIALQQAIDLGFAPEELKAKLADERLLVAVFKAAKWDALQRSKPELIKRAQDAKPMKVASRSAPQAQQASRALQARQSLKKTGDSNAAEAYFESMFKRT